MFDSKINRLVTLLTLRILWYDLDSTRSRPWLNSHSKKWWWL